MSDRQQGRADGRKVRVVVIGAGASGLCMGHALDAAGIRDWTIYEKGHDLGGTWRDNCYPGLSCDVPSRFYTFSFAPNPAYRSMYASGAQIKAYMDDVADRFGLRDRIRLGEEVTSARWSDGRWQLRTSAGTEDVADVLVSATGFLHHPHIPDLPGLPDFEGAAFHSARWDHSVPLDGARIGVVGTGSTGVQIVSALGPRASRLVVFQRTAQWVLPLPNFRFSRLTRWLHRHVPALGRRSYRLWQGMWEHLFAPAVVRPGWQRSFLSTACRLNLRFGVRDPELRRKVTPDYQPLCKRLVMSAGFYPVLQRPNVDVETEAIERIEPRGVRMRDGRFHELDVLVFATGFDARAFMRPMELVGEGGLSIDEAWAGGPRAYNTVAVPGFPNFFMLCGPHSPIGNQSILSVAESQSAYIVSWIRRLEEQGLPAVAPTAQATRRFNESMREAYPGTVWVTGCRSWYLGADGLPELWPWTPERHRELMSTVTPEDFEVHGPAAEEALTPPG
ncbi:MAG TPA: NAD(P)/FAD-dependent oxidoreductase [Baekduia sp.]|nr:NAD(P)/FAD-dependent oxidoreductase [Baekduia sp.]